MPSDYQKIIEAITRRMSSVAGIGNVHPGRMLTQDEDEFRALHYCEDQKRVHSWTVTREGFTDEQIATGHSHERLHKFRLRGQMALLNNINSDIQFQRLVDGIANALDNDGDLDANCEIQFPAQAETITERMFYETLCHYCELTIEVREYYESV